MKRQVEFGDPRVAHVRPQPHDRIVDRDGLRHELDDLAGPAQPGEGVHLDDLQEVARVLAANEPVERERHLLARDVLAAVAHRTGHVEDERRRALGRAAGPMHDEILRRRPRLTGAGDRVQDRLRHVERSGGVAELVGPRRRQLDRAVAGDDTFMSPPPRVGEIGEDRREQPLLIGPHRPGRGSVALCGALEPCLLGHAPQEFVHTALHSLEVRDLLFADELAKRFEIDDRRLRLAKGLLDLFEQPVDPREFLLHLERLGHVERLAAGEGIGRGELLDGEAIPKPRDRPHEFSRERRLVGNASMQSLELGELSRTEKRQQLQGEVVGNVHRLGRGAVRLVCFVLGRQRVVSLEDLPLAGFEHRADRLEARSEPGDLRGIEANRVGELPLGEAAPRSVHQEMVEHRVGGVATLRRRRRRRKLERVVAQIRVDHPAKRRRKRADLVAIARLVAWLVARLAHVPGAS